VKVRKEVVSRGVIIKLGGVEIVEELITIISARRKSGSLDVDIICYYFH